MTVEDQMAAELAKQYVPEGIEKVEPIIEKVEPVIEKVAPIVEKVEPVIEKVEPIVEKVEPIIEKVESVIAKSFEEELKERSKGKYNKWEDLETDLTPKEVFANEKIKKLNDFAAKGIDVTSREFLELQSIDFNNIKGKDQLIFEKWKRGPEGKDLSDTTIMHEINKKYNVAEWVDKEDSELTADDNANIEKMFRDANESKDWLNKYKDERTLEKAEDPKVLQALADEEKANLANWEKYVDSDLVNKITKFTTPITNKEGKVTDEFNFDISDQDRIEYGKVMKGLPIDTNVFFEQFIQRGENGKVVRDDVAPFIMMLKAKNYDKAVAKAYSDGAAKEAIRIEKESKNTNFVASEAESQPKTHSNVHDAQAEAVGKMKI